jgi:hypothetical protein
LALRLSEGLGRTAAVAPVDSACARATVDVLTQDASEDSALAPAGGLPAKYSKLELRLRLFSRDAAEGWWAAAMHVALRIGSFP